jgi:quercetin dioxygenase-like cupin family protein
VSLRKVHAFAVKLHEQPVEGVGDAAAGRLTWRTLICGDRTPSDELVIGIAQFPPRGVLNLHRHEHAEFYFGLSGGGTVNAAGSVFRIRRNVAVFIPGNTEHCVMAGQRGLSILYGFATRAFRDVIYRYSQARG